MYCSGSKQYATLLVTGLLKHMSAFTNTDFIGCYIVIRSNGHRMESGKAETDVSFTVRPQLPK
jgi:hypothetical protein